MIKNLLIIDDDLLTQKMLTMTINKYIFAQNIRTMSNGKEGVDYFKELANRKCLDVPDLVFLDINMPVMNGWEFLEEFTERYECLFPSVKICVLTSSVDSADSEKALSYPSVLMFISKPIRVEEINKLKSHEELKYFFAI